MFSNNEDDNDEDNENEKRAHKQVDELESCLSKSVARFETNAAEFCHRGGIFQMGSFIRIYADLMRCLNAQLRDDLHSADENPRIAPRLDQLFSRWDEFLDRVDQTHVTTF